MEVDFVCVLHGSLWDVELPRCVAVAAVGEAFNYVSQSIEPDFTKLARRFADIARVLGPGDLLLFDMAGPGTSGPGGSRTPHWSKGSVVLALEEREDAEALLLTRRIQTFLPVGPLHRRSEETHTLTLFRAEQVISVLEESGFAVEQLPTCGSMPPLSGWSVFATTKPS